uniref:Bestrophin homolog n=1 Tax=Heterorhabditis bacteriophora TaxID=37862 RepID=A0A1I7X166_HETBA
MHYLKAPMESFKVINDYFSYRIPIAVSYQSAYGICLLILLLAALPRILPLLSEPYAAPLVAIFFYLTGTMLNFFLLYVYWHWYWHVDTLWQSAVRVKFGEIVRNANNRSRRDRPMIPRELMEFPQSQQKPRPRPLSYLHTSTVTENIELREPFIAPLPIVATVLSPNCLENRMLKAQEQCWHNRLPDCHVPVRRKLPPTPDQPLSGEIALSRPLFYLPSSQI